MIEFQRVQVAEVWPSRCICGNQEGPFAQTHYFDEFYGEFFLCYRCIRAAARLLSEIVWELAGERPEMVAALAREAGFVSAEDHQAQLEQARGDLAKLERLTMDSVRQAIGAGVA